MRDTILEILAKRAPLKKAGEEERADREIRRSLAQLRAKFSRPRFGKSGRGGFSSLGARGVCVKEKSVFNQRVVIKASYVKSSNKNARARISHHLNYVGLNKGDEEKRAPDLYSADDKPVDIKSTIDNFAEAPRMFNFIISPEKGENMDLKEFTRDLVEQMEADLGTKLSWVAGNHYDTNEPHVHLLIKGYNDQGGNLVIRPDYISRGIRARASEIATNKLGLRDRDELIKSLGFEMHQAKKGQLDDYIRNSTRYGRIYTEFSDEIPRVLLEKRLDFLVSKELATKISDDVWEVKNNFCRDLQELARTSSMVEILAQGVKFNKQDCQVVTAKKLKGEAIKGHVVERGLVDKHGGEREYLLIKTKDKKYSYVELERHSEKSKALVGEFVCVEATKPFAGPKLSDQTIDKAAKGSRGIYDASEHEKSAQSSVSLPPGVTSKDYVQVHIKRLEVLARMGLAEKMGEGRFKVPKDFIGKLKARSQESHDNFKAHIKVIRLSPGRSKSPKINRGYSL